MDEVFRDFNNKPGEPESYDDAIGFRIVPDWVPAVAEAEWVAEKFVENIETIFNDLPIEEKAVPEICAAIGYMMSRAVIVTMLNDRQWPDRKRFRSFLSLFDRSVEFYSAEAERLFKSEEKP